MLCFHQQYIYLIHDSISLVNPELFLSPSITSYSGEKAAQVWIKTLLGTKQ